MRLFDTSSFYLALKTEKSAFLKEAYLLNLTLYEFGNIIWKEINLRKSLTLEEGARILKFSNNLIKSLKIIEPDYEEVLHLAVILKINFYDASFVQAAKQLKVVLVTEDKTLIKAAQKIIKICSLAELK